MGIIAAFIVPHPPLILHEVGRGEEEKIRETRDAYFEVGREIAKICPDTIVISSPHATMYADYFHVSPGERATGSFQAFRAPEVVLNEEYDTEFVKTMERFARKKNYPLGTEGERNPGLDHGTMVPLYFIRKHYGGAKIVRIGLSGLPLYEHYRVGTIVKKVAEYLDRRVVYIASGDLSHKLQTYGPYGFAPEGLEYDKRIMEVCRWAEFDKLFDFSEDFCEKAAECGHRSFVMMAGALDGMKVQAKVYSHQDVTGVGYGVCSFEATGEDEGRRFLRQREWLEAEEIRAKRMEEDIYVQLARVSVESYIMSHKRLNVSEAAKELYMKELPEEFLTKRAGAFVSIHKFGALRGCIGTILPTRENLAQEILQNAISASTEDPRFSAITERELPYLEISVDVLGMPEVVESEKDLDCKKYGVIVTNGRRRGLLLPDLEGVDTVEQQIAIAKRKAGIDEEEKVSLQRFEVVRHT
ncbi:MAG: AmmeMemoRadiSam system protein A [Lachnospiraceae bacterium]|nr:AmmeMemoRadiSam system protein A [Lachnospiraceae bacterium]